MASNTKSTTTLKWKGELTFEGTLEQFKTFTTSLEKYQVAIGVADLGNVIGDYHPAGYIRPIHAFLNKDYLEKLTDGASRMQMKAIEGIAGGIRNPHIHLGSEIVLVDRERFKEIIGEVAGRIAQERVDVESDYCEMVKAIQ